MGHNWIIDVIADLKSFADKNDLPVLASELDAVSLVAKAEITSSFEGAPTSVRGEQTVSGRISPQA